MECTSLRPVPGPVFHEIPRPAYRNRLLDLLLPVFTEPVASTSPIIDVTALICPLPLQHAERQTCQGKYERADLVLIDSILSAATHIATHIATH